MTRVAVMGGDGIGPEVVGATMHILEQMDLDLEFVKAHMGLNCFERTGEYLPAQTLRTLESSKAVLFGAITSPVTPTPATDRRCCSCASISTSTPTSAPASPYSRSSRW